MSDLICRKTMIHCQTPGMCSPHGGCSTGVLRETAARYSASSQPEPDNLPMIDAGKFIDYVWNMRAERDRLRVAVEVLRPQVEVLHQIGRALGLAPGSDLTLGALPAVEALRKDAELFRQLRDLPEDQLGLPGVPCVAVPEGPKAGRYVSGPDLDAAMAAKEGV